MTPADGPGSNIDWGNRPLFPADPNAFQPRPPTRIGTGAVPWHPPEIIKDEGVPGTPLPPTED
jgi:hypothetical protein